MFSQFFGNYLVENQKITAEQFSSCMKYIMNNHVKLGLIAEHEGLLTHSQATELNYMQMQSDKLFGDLAIEKGYLTQADVKYLLGKQGNPYLIFVQALMDKGCLTKQEIEECLISFQKDNGFSDSVMDAIKEGNIEKMLPAFIDDADSDYQELIGLTLRNIVRFISSYIRIDKGASVTKLPIKYAALQHTEGDKKGFLGFCCNSDGILAIADGYAKENFGIVDEDALDSVGEFANCVNGLYATELSYKDVEMDMLPPEYKFDDTLQGNGEFYCIPVYVEGKESMLVVQLGQNSDEKCEVKSTDT